MINDKSPVPKYFQLQTWLQDRIEQGFRFVTVGADGGLNAGASNALRLGREAAGRP